MPTITRSFIGPPRIDAAIGGRLRLIRLRLGLSRDDLAQQTRSTIPQIDEYEEGRIRIPAATLFKISRALGVCPADIFGPDPSDSTVN